MLKQQANSAFRASKPTTNRQAIIQQAPELLTVLRQPQIPIQEAPITSFRYSYLQRTLGNQAIVQRNVIYTGRILSEGSCQHLACQSRWACPSDSIGIACPDGTRNAFSKTQKRYRPLFTCDAKCENNISCDDVDNWMALPNNRFARRKCNQNLVICANGRFTHAYVRDRSHVGAWEVSPGITTNLGVSGTFTGSIYADENDPQFVTDTHCRRVPTSSKIQRIPRLIQKLSIEYKALQRKCTCGKPTHNGDECNECRQKRLGVQRKAAYQTDFAMVPSVSIKALPPLDSSIQPSCNKEAYYRSSPNYCLDTDFSPRTHPGERCYREITHRDSYFSCPPGNHFCFTSNGECHQSPDAASLAAGKEKDGTCKWNRYCVAQHIRKDYLPAKWKEWKQDVKKWWDNNGWIKEQRSPGDFPLPNSSPRASRWA